MDNESLRESFEIARQRGIDYLDSMNEVFAPDGLSYWDHRFKDDAEFLAWWLDQSTYPSPEFNVLHFLKEIAPGLYAEAEKRYLHATSRWMNGAA